MLGLVEDYLAHSVVLRVDESHGVGEHAGCDLHLHTSLLAARQIVPVAVAFTPYAVHQLVVLSCHGQHGNGHGRVGAGKDNPVQRCVHQNGHLTGTGRNHHISGDADVVRAHVHGQDVTVAVKDAVVQLVLVVVLQIGDRIGDGIGGMVQRVVGLDEIPLCIIQRYGGLAVVETIAHHGVEDDRVGKLLLDLG